MTNVFRNSPIPAGLVLFLTGYVLVAILTGTACFLR
jgi:hypothetical protein